MSAGEQTELVREELLAALETFTAEGMAESVAFGVDRAMDEVTAEVYGESGDVVAEYIVEISVRERGA